MDGEISIIHTTSHHTDTSLNFHLKEFLSNTAIHWRRKLYKKCFCTRAIDRDHRTKGWHERSLYYKHACISCEPFTLKLETETRVCKWFWEGPKCVYTPNPKFFVSSRVIIQTHLTDNFTDYMKIHNVTYVFTPINSITRWRVRDLFVITCRHQDNLPTWKQRAEDTYRNFTNIFLNEFY